MRNARQKYYNTKKVEHDGMKFDSKLEFFFHQRLIANHIPFEFQVTEELQAGFRDCNGKAIRKITAIVDFVIKTDKFIWYIDTKGWKTEVSKIKYKMLRYNKFLNNICYRIDMPKNQKECLFLIEEIKDIING